MQQLGLRDSRTTSANATGSRYRIVDDSNGVEDASDEVVESPEQRWRRRYSNSSSAFMGTRDTTSSRQVNLFTFDAQSSRRSAYVETKIGGHPLDHKLFFYPDRQQIRQPLKTAAYVAAVSLFSGGRASSPAYQITKHDVLDYAATKIGGHPLDHLPFINRGQPSRPLLGYIPPSPKPLLGALRTSAQTATVAFIGRNPANLYDCSRCMRMRQSPRVQLSCGHRVCASCVSSRSMNHVEAGEFCFLECTQCQSLVAIEAIVFSSQYAIRINAPSTATLSEFIQRSNGVITNNSMIAASSSSTAKANGWKYGGIVALLAFATKRLYPGSVTKQQITPAATIINNGASEADAVSFLDDVAAVEDTVENDVARWQKRVASLKAPSKLLKYEFVKTLGIGNFAEVMLVKRCHRSDGEDVLFVLKESDKLQEAVNEIHLLSRIHSPHVVRIFQYFIEEVGHRHFAYIEMEYCDRGDLVAYLKDKARGAEWHPGALDAATFDSLFRQLCLGLQEIHASGIIHRDLKPGNVLLTSEGVAKIADFGVSTWLESDLLTHHAAGTVAFMAPEVRCYFLGEDVSYDATADVWSLGVLAFAMLTGDPEPRVATRPLDELLKMLRKKGVQEKHVSLVERMLHAEPKGRASLTELLLLLPTSSAISSKL